VSKSRETVRTLLAVLAVAVLLAGSASAQKVKAEHAKGTDFSKFHTYAWIEGTPARQKIWHYDIVGAFDELLQAKGLKPAEPDKADLLIAYHVAVDTDLNVADLYVPSVAYAGASAPLGYYSGALLPGSVGRWVRKGTMLVDLVDRERKQVVWRAMASVTMKENNPKRLKQVNEVIEKIMAKYPPPKESK
jgi:hypothetical protein